MINFNLKKYLKEGKLFEALMPCPAPTQNVALNTANRDRAIRSDYINYGPLNVEEPGDYWEKVAEKWNTTFEAAFKSRCANCVAFDISPRMLDCIPGLTSEPVEEPDARKDIDIAFKGNSKIANLVKEGVLGYCWMHHFKCHSARACNTWAAGGPINKDSISYEWQERNSEAALNPEPIDPDLYKDD